MVGRAVASVLAQTFAGLEVLVVDDGSTDDSVAAARAVADGRVRIVRQEARGVEAARHSGAARAHGRWVTVLDPDDEVAPGWLARIGRLIDATGATLVSCGGEQVHADGSATTVSPSTIHAGRDGVLACFRPGAFVVRRDLLESVGSFGGDDRTASLAQVGELLVDRVLELGQPMVSTPEALVRWNEPSVEATPHGDALRLRWALQSLDALARTPIPDAAQLVHSATVGAIAAVRLDDHRQARRLFRLARGVAPGEPRVWARWAVSCVPPLASRVWAAVDEPAEDVVDLQEPTDPTAEATTEATTGAIPGENPTDSLELAQ